ncbi:hypothetical protein JHK85_046526 [Glycine max]|nr:hypothetical protein JHK85_046526 [Glycine max]
MEKLEYWKKALHQRTIPHTPLSLTASFSSHTSMAETSNPSADATMDTVQRRLVFEDESKHEKDKWVRGGESSGYVARKRRIMAYYKVLLMKEVDNEEEIRDLEREGCLEKIVGH